MTACIVSSSRSPVVGASQFALALAVAFAVLAAALLAFFALAGSFGALPKTSTVVRLSRKAHRHSGAPLEPPKGEPPMPRLNACLSFDRNCAEAMKFYGLPGRCAFGMVTDRFGVPWGVNSGPRPQATK